MANRHAQRREQTHQQLLEAAEQVFAEKGYHNASILDVTEAADVSKRTFYLHFKSKDDLIEALALSRFDDVRLRIENDKEHQEITDPRRLQWGVVYNIFDYALQNPDMHQMIVSDDGSHRLNSLTRQYIALAMENGFAEDDVCVFREDAPVPAIVAAHAMAGAIFQLFCWWADHKGEYTPADMADMSVSLFFDGLPINFVEIDVEATTTGGD